MKYQVIAFAIMTIVTACGGSVDHDHEEVDRHDHKHNPDEIHLEADRARACGVVVDTVKAADFTETVRVAGEILEAPQSLGIVSAPVAGRVTVSRNMTDGSRVSKGAVVAVVSADGMAGGDANRANRIALEAARAELDRVTPLREAGIVTVSEYNAARQAYEMALNATRGASGNAVSPISGTIVSIDVTNGQYVEAGAQIATVSNLDKLTLRADLPMRYRDMASKISGASFKVPYSDRLFTAASRSSSTLSSASGGYVPVYFNVDNSGGVSPGSYADVYLSTGSRPGVVAVPAEAVVERLGARFVYVRIDEDCYEKRPVTVGATDGRLIELTAGVNPGDAVVVEGASYVRLAETSGAVPQGHTHNH